MTTFFFSKTEMQNVSPIIESPI